VSDSAARLADGEWHRLHPASPLLKGGIALLAVLGVVLANLRERLLALFVPQFGEQDDDPVDYILGHGLVLQALAVVAVVLLVLVFAFYLSWRMHSFRVTEEVVEVRSGIVFRTNRKARLDRIQGINIQRPFFARLFGAAKLEINQAGQDANVALSYLYAPAADVLRAEILRRASGGAPEPALEPEPDGRRVFDRRVEEFLTPEIDPRTAEPGSVVHISAPRLAGATVLSLGFLVSVVLIGVAIALAVRFRAFGLLFVLVPFVLAMGNVIVRRFLRSLRYRIAGSPDGVRIGYGLFSTSNETLPPGRIHSIEISQTLFWRIAGWWEIKVNRAGHSSTQGAQGQANTTIMPVGVAADVNRVLELILPGLPPGELTTLIGHGLGRTAHDPFTTSPRRAAVLRWLSWRRNGFLVTDDLVAFRSGAVWRRLVIVPQSRLQSVAIRQGPLERALRLATIRLHTVAGPIRARLGAVDRDAAVDFFGEVASGAVAAGHLDTTHRWREGRA